MSLKKRYLITGGTSGVGKSIAKRVAKNGNELILLGRNPVKGEQILRELKEETGNNDIVFFSVDVSSSEKLTQFIKLFKQKYNYLDALINAAGGIINQYQLTKENIEMNWSLNYLSHYILCQGLLELLKKSESVRILTVAGHPSLIKHTKPNFHYMDSPANFNGLKAAAQTALARVGLTLLLADQLKNSKVTVQAFYPGEIKSNLANSVKFPQNIPLLFLQAFAKKECTIGQYLATAAHTQPATGVFFDKNGKTVSTRNIFNDHLLSQLDSLSKKQTAPFLQQLSGY